jgi:hypothetical protein
MEARDAEDYGEGNNQLDTERYLSIIGHIFLYYRTAVG